MARKIIRDYLPPMLRDVGEEIAGNLGISETELMGMILVDYALREGYLRSDRPPRKIRESTFSTKM